MTRTTRVAEQLSAAQGVWLLQLSSQAVQAQGERILAVLPGNDLADTPNTLQMHADFWLMTVALMQHRRILVDLLAADENRTRVLAAIHALDETCPELKTVRDCLEHLEKYLAGIGQRKRGKRIVEIEYLAPATADDRVIAIRLEGDGQHFLSVRSCLSAVAETQKILLPGSGRAP